MPPRPPPRRSCPRPPGRAFAAWLAAFNSGGLARVREFDRTSRHEGGPPPEATLDVRERTGRFTLLRFEKQEPTTIVALLQERDSETVARMELSATAGDPPATAKTTRRTIPRPDDLAIPRLSETAALAALGRSVDELAAADRFSGVAAVARRGQVIFERAAGRANRETNAPAAPETRFRIGSMNKMFTAVATLRLVEGRKLTLDDAVGKHLTDYPNKAVAAKVTIRHLLTHTGGTGNICGPDFTKHRLTAARARRLREAPRRSTARPLARHRSSRRLLPPPATCSASRTPSRRGSSSRSRCCAGDDGAEGALRSSSSA